MSASRAYAVFAPLDAVRRAWLSIMGPLARSWIVERDKRVSATLGFAVVFAVVAACTYPIVLLAMGPLILGVPHIFADIRYLVTRQGLHKRWWLYLTVAVPLVIYSLATRETWASCFAWGAVGGAALVARGSWRRRIPVLLFSAAMVFLVSQYGYPVALFIAHFHNVFALVVIWRWRAGRKKTFELVPFVLYASAAIFILAGGFEPIVAWTGGGAVTNWELDLPGQGVVYAPDGWGIWGPRAVVFFAFAQSVHYGVWLRAVPDEARASKTPRSFVQSAKALVGDMSWPVALVALVMSAGVAGWAAHNVFKAREAYFAFAGFHGYLEFAVFAFLFCEGGDLFRVPTGSRGPRDSLPDGGDIPPPVPVTPTPESPAAPAAVG